MCSGDGCVDEKVIVGEFYGVNLVGCEFDDERDFGRLVGGGVVCENGVVMGI